MPTKFFVKDIQGNQKQTTLHQAVKENDYKSLRIIFQNYPMIKETVLEGTPTLLHQAVQDGNVNMVEFLLKIDVFTQSMDENRKTPLHWAILIRNMDMIKMLFAYGAYPYKDWPSYWSERRWSSVIIAIQVKDLEILQYLLDKWNGLAHRPVANGELPLHVAARVGFLDGVKCLISFKANVNAGDDAKMTPLHVSAFSGEVDVLKFLLENDANINAQDDKCWTPLHYAVQSGNMEITQELLKNGASIEATDIELKTPLHISVESKKLEIVELLLLNKANIFSQDVDGFSVLHLAAKYGADKIGKFLIEFQPNIVEMTDNDGLNVFQLAILSKKKIVLESIMEKITTKDPEFWSKLLKLAILTGEIDMFQFLLKKEFACSYDFSALTKAVLVLPCFAVCLFGELAGLYDPIEWKNRTPLSKLLPLHYAAEVGNLEAVKKLVEIGYNVDLKDNDKKTPFDIALDKKFYEVCLYLKSKMTSPLVTEGTKTCEICMGPRNGVFAFIPCGHSLSCEKCCLKILASRSANGRCPYCRTKIEKYNKIFIL